MSSNLTPNNTWKSVLLIAFAALGMLGLTVRGAYLIWRGVADFSLTAAQAAGTLGGNVLDAISMGFCVLLLIPGIVYSLQLLRGQTVGASTIPPMKLWQGAALALAWLVLAVAGSILSSLFAYGWAVLALFFPLGVALPIVFLVWIGSGGLPTGSVRRSWAVFSLALAGSTVLALLAEYLVVGVGALFGWAALLAHPEWQNVLQQLQKQVTHATDIPTLLTVLGPYLTNPLVVLLVLVFAAGIGPLIEEAAKPAAIWLLGRHLRAPSEGFALGLICGAGFALLEGVTAASGFSQLWGVGMAGRAASSLMHIMGSGLVGWGIASARLGKGPWRLVGAYLGAVCLHGLWNASVVLAVVGGLRVTLQKGQFDLIGILLTMAGVGLLGLLVALILIALPVANRLLRRGGVAPQETAGKIDV